MSIPVSPESSYTNTLILPMHRGYSLGGVIHETDYLMPFYFTQLAELSDRHSKKTKEKEEFEASPEYKSATKAIQTAKTTMLSIEVAQISKQLEAVTKEFNDKCANQPAVKIQKALPYDEDKVKIINKDVSFESERMKSLEFIGGGDILKRVDNFVKNLFLDVPTTILPAGTIESMSREIQTTLESEGRVVVIGSFVTLARVKRLHPLIIPRTAKIDDELQTNASKYLVLYEAVLGGVFLSIGKSFKTLSEVAPKDEVNQNLLSSLSTVSFTSQGAIPKTNPKTPNLNLWEVYCNWKETLTTDIKCGFPIGYKVRSLTAVLDENRKYYEDS